MAIVANSPKLHDLIDPAARIEQIARGCGFTEGPIWNHAGNYLLFSDMPQDRRRKWSEAGGVEVVLDPSNKCNGMTYDASGNLIVCEHVTSSVVRERPDGTRETLATHWQGKELNSPNDVVVAPDGEHLGVIEFPEHTGNLSWGGSDWRTLIVAASTGVSTVRTKVAAHREPYMA